MNVLITGGTGFVGSRLAQAMLDQGWHVTLTGRSQSDRPEKDRLTRLVCDTTENGPWQDAVATSDVIVNLAGKNIFTPWNPRTKHEIRESRILTTRNLVDAMPEKTGIVFLSTSASGYYGDRGEELLSEESVRGQGFLADLCRDWEAEALKAEEKGARVVCMRFSMILGSGGGALDKMLTPFKLCMGGNLGRGNQWMSWMHLEDLVSAVLFLIEENKAQGPVNFCAPFAVRNRDFTKHLAAVLGRPAFFHVPSFLIRGLMGELGAVLLGSQRMSSSTLENLGFTFGWPEVEQALGQILGRG